MKTITLYHVEHIVFSLAKEHFSFSEPIPDYTTRFPHILESCLSTPFQTFGGKDLYSTFLSKSSIMFYLMIKNHPFQNGNKRIAMTTLFVFLIMNNKWIKVDPDSLYQFTIWIAASDPKVKDATVQAINQFISSWIVDA